MLEVTVPMVEGFDEASEEFVVSKAVTLQLEHSLASLSKWESKWEKPFLGKEEKTSEQTLDYIRTMTLTPGVPEEVYRRLPDSVVEQVMNYINSKQSATWFNEKNQKPSNEVITAEIIYHWMVALRIPFIPCETWHLNRLITLVRISNQKNQPGKKMSRRELAQRNRELNAQRRANLGTRG